MNLGWIVAPLNRIGQRYKLLGGLWLLCLGCLLTPVFAEQHEVPGYQLGPGDAIVIKVDDEPDLTLDTKVSAQGTLYFVFLGDISVVGLTSTQLQKKLEALLADGYLQHPRVNVSIKEYRLVFIQGEVKSPGGIPYQPNLNVRKAIVLTGGFTDVANKDRITIIRGNDKNFKEQPIELDEAIFPGDVVTVQESFW